MKKIVLTGTGALLAVGAMVLTGCSDDPSPFGGNSGKLVPTVNLDSRVTASERGGALKAPQSRAESTAMEISVDDLTLTLTPKDGSTPFTCKGVSAFPLDKEFKVGEYQFEASYGDPAIEGFELPAYYGTETVIVEENRTSSVSLSAQLINSMVSLEFGDALVEYATDLSAHLQTTGEKIAFTTTETRPAYIQPGTATVSVTLTKPNGVSGTVTIPTFTAKAKYHHHVKLDLTNGSGDAVLNITFDDTVENEDVNIDLSDEILNAPAPTAVAKGFTSGEAVSFVPGLGAADAMTVDITAQASIASVMMSTKSASLQLEGWPAEIDLVKATASEQQLLKSLGLDVLGLFKNPGRMAVVDFTKVCEHISYMDGGNNDTEITLTVIDTASKSADPVTLSLAAEALELGLTAVTTAYPDAAGMPIELSLSYNGNKPAEELSFLYNNERGTWTPLEVESIEVQGRAASTYKVIVKAPAIDFSVSIKAVCTKLGKESETVVVKQVPFKLVASENDTFAHSTVLTVTSTKLDAAEVAKNGTLTLSPAASTAVKSIEGNKISVSGLSAGTTYKATLSYDGDECNAAEFTTESELQIPNGNLDANVTIAASGSKWQNVVFEGWGTNNAMTTSQPTGGNPASDNHACKAASGTQQVDGVSGKAAMLRNVGWGSANSASGSKGTSGTCKYVDVGLLHLGSTRTIRPSGYGSGDNISNSCSTGPLTTDDLDCGISFASRPSSMTFQYKYTPKNSADKGYALITVYDSSNNVIATQEMLLDASTSFVERTVQLSYPAGSNKGAKLYVKFMASYSMDYLKRSNDNYSGPGFMGQTNGFFGSELYIDEVVLNY